MRLAIHVAWCRLTLFVAPVHIAVPGAAIGGTQSLVVVCVTGNMPAHWVTEAVGSRPGAAGAQAVGLDIFVRAGLVGAAVGTR